MTDRGRPFAVIVAIGRESAEEAALQAMAGEGLITPAARKGPMPSPRWRPVKIAGASLSETVIDARDDRV